MVRLFKRPNFLAIIINKNKQLELDGILLGRDKECGVWRSPTKCEVRRKRAGEKGAAFRSADLPSSLRPEPAC